MIKFLHYRTIIIHGLIWVLLFFLNYLLISNYPVTFKPIFHIQIWVIYLLVFYLNLLFLLPFLFFNRRFILYLFSCLILIGGSHYITVEIRKFHFSKMETQRVLRTEQAEASDQKEIRTEKPSYSREVTRHTSPRGRYFQRRAVLFSLTGILLIFSLSFAYGLFVRYQENEKIRLETEKEKIETELNSLKKQVNPHFLFNSLNSIYSLANSSSAKTTEAVLKLSDMLRYMIYDTEKPNVQLQQEFSGLQNYIELQKLRLTEKTVLRINIQNPDTDYKIEPLLLLPIVENAFKYGSDNLNDTIIIIEASAENGKLRFFCANTIIPGLRENVISETSGFGLKNVKRRLELLYPDQHVLRSEEKDGTFLVDLKINLKK